MSETGTVREFDADEGWGVIDAPGVPCGCWVHFSAIAAPGYRSLTAGQAVRFRAVPAVCVDGERFQAHLGAALVHGVRVLDRPGHRGAAGHTGDLGAVDLRAALVDQDPVAEHGRPRRFGLPRRDRRRQQRQHARVRRARGRRVPPAGGPTAQ